MSFPGFETVEVPVGATTSHAAVGGSGPPVRGRALDCGHFLPEEAPGDTAAEPAAFFRASPD